ncbi:MAG: MFS transporter [Orrella sp.]|jgi:MFS transporter, MHS family, shikimate and dehydroshikimate transport protein|uniref:MFS transporter n=1 Tax=Orrella sp. TaxID=1921583 RepID=UPI00276CFE77|nr:MHS family MFS transporter [Burkholderiales bacterium]
MTKTNKELKKVVISALIGSTIEWYDFFLYGVVAGIVFSKLYFPSHDPYVSILLAYATFAVGFVSRPLGGVIFGHFGDRIGRKSALVSTLIIMGVATFLIGVTPTYDQIGIAAPIMLLMLRILQGIGLGGEWGGAILMTYEHAPKDKRGFYASIPQIGLSLGLFLAAGTVALLSFALTDEQFLNWGWRVAFILSAVMVAAGLYIRTHVKESPEFEAQNIENKNKKIPIITLFKDYRKSILQGMGARYIDGVFFNIFGVFVISYLTQTIQITRTDALIGVMIAAVMMCFFIPFFGALSDRVGRARVYFWGSIFTSLSAIPAFWAMQHSDGNPLVIWVAVAIPLGVLFASIFGPEAALFCGLFDPPVRYTGISFVYQFSGIFASGITPLIATALIRTYDGQPWGVVGYVLFAGLVSALSARWIGRTQVAKDT